MSDLNTRFILSLFFYGGFFYFGYEGGYGDGEPSIMAGIVTVILVFVCVKFYSLIFRLFD